MPDHREPKQAEVMTLIISSLSDLLSRKDQPLSDPLQEFTHLIGSKSVLDSLGLVELVVEVEGRLEEEYGVSLVLAGDDDLTQKDSPFKSVKSLTDYICSLIGEDRQGK